jgi:ACS family glucarate transporter-like MFS transporter
MRQAEEMLNMDSARRALGHAEVATARASHVRWWVLSIVMAIMAVTALNRLNLSIAGKPIEEEFKFSTEQMGLVFSAFLWGYALFQVPWGYICDRIGPRRTLTAAILCFSAGAGAVVLIPFFAAATGVSALAAFRLIRFLTGVGEAAISSNVTRVIASWTSQRERGFASGLQVCGLGLGGTLTPVFIAWTMTRWGWRSSFAACSILGFAAVALWYWYATDWPEQHRGVNEAELQAVHPGSWKRSLPAQLVSRTVPWLGMLANTSVWALIIGYGLHGYAFYVYYNWFYFYAVKMRGLGVMQAAVWTAAPFLAMAILSPVGGWFSDRLMRTLDTRSARQRAVWLGVGISSMMLYAGSHLSATVIALPMIALAAGFNMFAAANFWAACIDLAPEHSASLSALMNTMSAIGGAISATVTASVVVHQSWTAALNVAVWATLGAGLLFTFVNANRTVDDHS